MNKPHTYEEKEAYFQEILEELMKAEIKTISNQEIKKRFLEKHCFISDKDFKRLNIREKLSECGIMSKKVRDENKKMLFEKLLENLLEEKVSKISNKELINLMKKEYGVVLREVEISSFGFRDLLEKNGISSTQVTKISIIDDTIEYLLANDIEVDNITALHKYTKRFGSISRSTLDNNLDYIQKRIDIKNLKVTKRTKALDMTDEDIMIQVGLYYIQKNVKKITAAEFRAHTHERYRTVDIKVIKSYKTYFLENYNLDIVSVENHQENQTYRIEEILNFLKTVSMGYTVQEAIDVNQHEIDRVNRDVFIVSSDLPKKVKLFWDEYVELYIRELAKSRINVKNAFLNADKKELKVDTEKKEIILLQHAKLNIETVGLLGIIKLTMFILKSSQKEYGIHAQNMYIGFLIYLHTKNSLILPYSYLYDICYLGKKVQVELAMFLGENKANQQFLKALQEKRLNVKDDKYKRIFQFFLLSIPLNKSISSITYQDLSPLQDRSKNNFKRVVDILNSLGADINLDKPKGKYTEKYIFYTKYSKYAKLIELFNKTMNRAYKLGDYSKEANIYKNWSTQYTQFLDFIEQNYTNTSITESFLYQIFDYPNEERVLTYQEYIQEQEMSASAKDKRFTPLIVAFSGSTLYPSLKNIKDKKPIFKSTNDPAKLNQKRAAITNPIAIKKLEDILRNRPPKSNYFTCLDIDKKYTKWWSHYDKVAPFEPLILLMHLYIPARGINFRLADRNSFLVKNDKGVTTGYHFIHDKNKKRKKPYVAPNIWGDDLKIIEDFIEYSKIHFNTLKPITYDKQNPRGIVPLFPNNKGNSFYSESQHMKYWKRVLLKAQIELNSENHMEDIVLIYPNSDIEMPKNPNDVDLFSQGEMEKFTVRYDLHSLRHTGASRYANAGMPMGLVALLTGHIDMNVLQSVYVEIDEKKMIALWESMQHIELEEGISLSNAGESLIGYIQSMAKDIFLEKSAVKLLEFLKQEKFITIGAYTAEGKLTQYELEDFAKIDPIFWSFRTHGICTSTQCPQGLENRCSLCPHFITSPAYAHKIAMQINLQNFRLSKYVNMIIENRENGNPQNNESIRKSALLETEDMLGWTEILRTLDECQVDTPKKEAGGKDLVTAEATNTSIFSLSPIVNGDHALMKLVYNGLEYKEFGNESLQDASEKMVSKIIRYASRKGKFQEIDGADKYDILKWFYPVYEEIKVLERQGKDNDTLLEILDNLSEKPVPHLIGKNEIKVIKNQEKK